MLLWQLDFLSKWWIDNEDQVMQLLMWQLILCYDLCIPGNGDTMKHISFQRHVTTEQASSGLLLQVHRDLREKWHNNLNI